jgi:hypothetical protein
MRITIEHPVIASGSLWHGAPRYELARTASEFEFRELSEHEAPLAFTDGIDRRSIRVVDGKLHRAWFHINPASESLGENGALREALFGGGALDFRPLGRLVREAAQAIEKADPSVLVANTTRVLEMRDRKKGHTELSIMCVKASKLRSFEAGCLPT